MTISVDPLRNAANISARWKPKVHRDVWGLRPNRMVSSMANTSVRTWPESLTRARLRLNSPPKNSRAVKAEAMLRAAQRRSSVALEFSTELPPIVEDGLLCVGRTPKAGFWLEAKEQLT